jgi:hypothetical protein
MRDYKGWTAKERLASLKKTKAAIAAGVVPPPTKCNRCGKETGRIDYHNHDYSDPIKYLEPLCQGCHTRLHRLENKEMETKAQGSLPKSSEPESEGDKTMSEKSANVNIELSDWLEKGMKLPLKELSEHVRSTPVGVKPLKALRGLGIVFCNGFTKEYNCPGYPQAAGIGKDRPKFDIVLERIRFHERNGETFKVKGEQLSKKLESNYDYNKQLHKYQIVG